MKRFVFGECVQGFSHICSGTECQDNMKSLELENGTILMAVADGHGSKSCPYSKTGSQIAVDVFCQVIENLVQGYRQDPDLLPSFLHREGSLRLAQTIHREWQEAVLAAHEAMEREMPLTVDGQPNQPAVYRMYGSTLLGLMITDSYVFAFQIGDGDILLADDDGITALVEAEKLLGVESHSLSSMNAWKRAASALYPRNREAAPMLYLMSTDGFANSHVSETEFRKTCLDYYSFLKEYGPEALEANLHDWLAETSRLGCGDDTTVLLAYFSEEPEEIAELAQTPKELEEIE